LEIENLENSPISLSRESSFKRLDNDDASVASNTSGKRKKKHGDHLSDNQSNTSSPRMRRDSFQQIPTALLSSQPPKLSRQHSFDSKHQGQTSNQAFSTPPLRKAKSVIELDDSTTASSTQRRNSQRKAQSAKRSSFSHRGQSGKKKRVTFRNPVVEPDPDNISLYNSYGDTEGIDNDASNLEDEMDKRRDKHRRRRRDDDGLLAGCGCIIA
jgi:hypothetical protein